MVPEVVQMMAPELGSGAVAQPASMAASYNFSLADVARFESAYYGTGGMAVAPQEAAAAGPPSSLLDSPAMRAFLGPLDRVNTDAMNLAQETQAMAADGDISPGQMLMMSVRCHEFMFHCEVTSNVANRTSDGFQQLFRQQA